MIFGKAQRLDNIENEVWSREMGYKNKKGAKSSTFCERGRSRTLNLQSRNLTLYPIELRVQCFYGLQI